MIAGDGAWFAIICRQLLPLLGDGRDRLLLYLEFEGDWSGGSVYVDEGSRIAQYMLEPDLWASIFRDWAELPEDKIWCAMSLRLSVDGTFGCSFLYPGEIYREDPEFPFCDGRDEAAARAEFGDKPIYSARPIEDGFDLSAEP